MNSHLLWFNSRECDFIQASISAMQFSKFCKVGEARIWCGGKETKTCMSSAYKWYWTEWRWKTFLRPVRYIENKVGPPTEPWVLHSQVAWGRMWNHLKGQTVNGMKDRIQTIREPGPGYPDLWEYLQVFCGLRCRRLRTDLKGPWQWQIRSPFLVRLSLKHWWEGSQHYDEGGKLTVKGRINCVPANNLRV